MKIATWNINGVKARIANLCEWLQSSAPDVVCLQEIKSVDEGFPRLEIEALGVAIKDDDVDTIGGVVANHLGRMPHKGESFELDGLRFEILRADARQIHVLLVEKLPPPPPAEAAEM